jgi:hypothetical protein
MELELATHAPHDVVMLDGSLTTPIIHLNQALSRLNDVPDPLSTLLKSTLRTSLHALNDVLRSRRSDRAFVGLPKYTTKQVIAREILRSEEYEDRGMLSFILEPGEYVGPINIQPDKQQWHIGNVPSELRQIADEMIAAVFDLHIVYYRPYRHVPALRLEMAKSIASNRQRLAVLLESMRLQCGAPGLFEPYPLFLADRMVKHLHTALPAIRQTTTQEMSSTWDNGLEDVYLAMHGYRTEWGR